MFLSLVLSCLPFSAEGTSRALARRSTCLSHIPSYNPSGDVVGASPESRLLTTVGTPKATADASPRSLEVAGSSHSVWNTYSRTVGRLSEAPPAAWLGSGATASGPGHCSTWNTFPRRPSAARRAPPVPIRKASRTQFGPRPTVRSADPQFGHRPTVRPQPHSSVANHWSGERALANESSHAKRTTAVVRDRHPGDPSPPRKPACVILSGKQHPASASVPDEPFRSHDQQPPLH